MPRAGRTKASQTADPVPDTASEIVAVPKSEFDPSLARQMREIGSAGLNPSSALDLVMRLIAEVPAASKESMDQIKMLDKLINTARAMMETKLKTEEAAIISARIDELERRLETLKAPVPGSTAELTED